MLALALAAIVPLAAAAAAAAEPHLLFVAHQEIAEIGEYEDKSADRVLGSPLMMTHPTDYDAKQSLASLQYKPAGAVQQ